MTVHQLVRQHGLDGARQRLPAADWRFAELAAQILGDEAAEIAYLYSGFAMTSLPHRKLPHEGDPWQRQNGRFSLLVEPGYLPGPLGRPTLCGVPYGSRARLILLYLQSQAIRSASPIVHLGQSMHDWMGRMGVNTGGTNYRAIRDQARRISACRLTVGWVADDGRSGFERANIVSAMLFVPAASGAQGCLWDEVAHLSPEFFAALREHPVPVAETAIRCIQNSSAVLDLYIWLCYRLRSIKSPTTISWAALHQQFGAEYASVRKFRQNFIANLKEACAVYPDAEMEVSDVGLVLRPSAPAVPERPIRLVR